MPRRGIVALATVLCFSGVLHAQRAEEFVTGLKLPVDFAADPTADDRFYIVEQKTNRIRVIENGSLRDEPFLELPGEKVVSRGWEQGMLGICFDPDYETNGYFYINYTGPRKPDARGNDPGYTYISRFKATDAHTVDPASEHVILKIAQPYSNHNCGCLRFGPDGMLYIGLGDGGAANDPEDRAQDLTELMGKMLRVDPREDQFPDDPDRNYTIPADNPFVAGAAPEAGGGASSAPNGAAEEQPRPEIWALGLRNPWKFEFDSRGRMWIGDVGQNRFEFVHLQKEGSRGGENYGWDKLEGWHEFLPRDRKNQQPDPPRLSQKEIRKRGFEPAIWEYRQWHPRGDQFRNGSITGGFFYEGDAVPALKDRYIFADFMFGKVWTLRIKEGRADDVIEITGVIASAFPEGDMNLALSSFGRDNEGELYILDHKGGRVLKIVQ